MKWKLEVDIEAETIGEAFKVVENLPTSLRPFEAGALSSFELYPVGAENDKYVKLSYKK